VISVYRRAIDLYSEGKLTPEIKKEMFIELETVYNRGFSSGFYFGAPSGDEYCVGSGNQATTKKVYVGGVLNYYKKSKIAHVLLQAGDLGLNDKIYIIGNSTGTVELSIDSLMKDESLVTEAEKGSEVTFVCAETVRLNDQVYKIVANPAANQPKDALASSSVSYEVNTLASPVISKIIHAGLLLPTRTNLPFAVVHFLRDTTSAPRNVESIICAVERSTMRFVIL